MRPITCYLDAGNNRVIFRNVNKFTGRYLKFYYYAQSPSASVFNHNVQLLVYGN